MEKEQDYDVFGFATVYRRKYPKDWTASMILAYADMVAYASESGICYKSQGDIAKNWGLIRETVNIAMHKLEKCGAIKFIGTHGNKNGNYTNIYQIAMTAKPSLHSKNDDGKTVMDGDGKTVTKLKESKVK